MERLKPCSSRNNLAAMTEPKKRDPDFVRMACTSASVSFRELLTEDELVRVLVTGKVPRNRRPHLRSLLEEAPENLGEDRAGTPRAQSGTLMANVVVIGGGNEINPEG